MGTGGTAAAMSRRCSAPRPAPTRSSRPSGPIRRTRGASTSSARRCSTLARVAAEGVGVTECRISVASAGSDFVVLTARSRIGGGPSEEASPPERPVAHSREVLRSGRRLVISDLAATNLLERADAELLRQRGDNAVLAVPMATTGPARAVLELVESRFPRAFSGANVAFAEFIARQARRLVSDETRDDSVDLAPELPSSVVETGPPELPAAPGVATLDGMVTGPGRPRRATASAPVTLAPFADGRGVARALDLESSPLAAGLRRVHRLPGGGRRREPVPLRRTSRATPWTTAGRGKWPSGRPPHAP